MREHNDFLVSLVGRPNVGKSTLFNRWVGRREAIVHRTPGVTRDRVFGRVNWVGISFQVSDVAGYPPEGPFLAELERQIERAMQGSSLILLLVDATTGITREDRILVTRLRKLRKPFALVVNKADNATRENEGQVYHGLGVEPVFFISAENGRGVDVLLDFVISQIPVTESAEPEGGAVRIVIAGRRNVGKSTLLNALVKEERAVTSSIPGTTRDVVESEVVWKKHRFLVADTAGMAMKTAFPDELEFYSELRARRAVEQADVAWLVLDSAEGILKTDKKIAAHMIGLGRSIVVVANKWDLARYNKTVMKEFKDYAAENLSFLRFAPTVFISALESWNLDALFKTSLHVLEESRQRLTTSELNKVVHDYITTSTLPSKGTRVLRIYYATQTGVSPPVFQLFVNDPAIVNGPFLASFAKFIREFHPFEGAPIRFSIRARRAIMNVKGNK